MSGGWVKMDRDLLSHTEDGRLTARELLVYMALRMMASPDTGTCFTSALWVSSILGFETRKHAQPALDALESKGYILRSYLLGQKKKYTILVDDYPITLGANTGRCISVAATRERDHITDEVLDDPVKRHKQHDIMRRAISDPVLTGAARGTDDASKITLTDADL